MSSCRVKPVHPTLPVPARTTRQLRRLPSPESLARSSSSDCLVKRPSFFAAAAADFGNGFSRSSRLAPVRWPLCTHRRLPDSIAVGERALGSSVVPKLPAAMYVYSRFVTMARQFNSRPTGPQSGRLRMPNERPWRCCSQTSSCSCLL